MKRSLSHTERFYTKLKSVFKFKRPTDLEDLGTSPFSEGERSSKNRVEKAACSEPTRLDDGAVAAFVSVLGVA